MAGIPNNSEGLFPFPSGSDIAGSQALFRINSPIPSWILATISLTLASLLYAFASQQKATDENGNGIPNGPSGLPIVGVFPFISRYPELVLDRWAKKFGDLYSMWIGNQLFIVVSDPLVAKDLLITNGAMTSSRKEMFIKSQTVFAGRGITATPYNDRWRKHRRIAFSWLNQAALERYTDTIDREATSMLKALFLASDGGRSAVNPQPHAGRCSLNNMTTITFGFRTDSIDDPFVSRALELSREFMNCTGPVANLVDFVSVLQKLPSPMLSRGKRLHQGLVDTYGGIIEETKQKLQRGIPVDACLAKSLIEMRDEESLDDLDMAIMASAFLIGGVETTAAIMQWFTALIPAYPEVQKKAQAELDRVVGRSRMPTVEDEKNLPYCHAIIKEIERVHNPFWLGTPHVSTQGFTYRGKYIPKDSVIVLNTWTMHHDPKRYEDPHEFRPERFLEDSSTSAESANLSDPYERDHWMFGAGRRICPGMLVAEREIWLTVSRLIWAFDMTEVPDQPIDLKEYDGMSGRSPVPFKINMIPRDDKVGEILANVRV